MGCWRIRGCGRGLQQSPFSSKSMEFGFLLCWTASHRAAVCTSTWARTARKTCHWLPVTETQDGDGHLSPLSSSYIVGSQLRQRRVRFLCRVWLYSLIIYVELKIYLEELKKKKMSIQNMSLHNFSFEMTYMHRKMVSLSLCYGMENVSLIRYILCTCILHVFSLDLIKEK